MACPADKILLKMVPWKKVQAIDEFEVSSRHNQTLKNMGRKKEYKDIQDIFFQHHDVFDER